MRKLIMLSLILGSGPLFGISFVSAGVGISSGEGFFFELSGGYSEEGGYFGGGVVTVTHRGKVAIGVEAGASFLAGADLLFDLRNGSPLLRVYPLAQNAFLLNWDFFIFPFYEYHKAHHDFGASLKLPLITSSGEIEFVGDVN